MPKNTPWSRDGGFEALYIKSSKDHKLSPRIVAQTPPASSCCAPFSHVQDPPIPKFALLNEPLPFIPLSPVHLALSS